VSGKVYVIFGGAGGIGAAVTEHLSREGARIVVADLHGSTVASALSVTCDLTDPAQCDAAAQAAIDHFGGLDGMVNCAGVSKPHDSLTLPPADWARMVDVQLNGAFYAAQACAKRMWTSGGAIVLISSTNAEAAFPRRAVGRAAKAGVAMLMWPPK
jgi:meso-butanediol dehydrogenase / (S,S)-butanediol dehydrogenase / diacetyl reductase